MSRKNQATPRHIEPDRRFNSVLVSKFINNLMKKGKRSTAENIIYTSMDNIAEKVSGTEPIEVFEQAIENIKPIMEVRSRRVGGANYQIPVEVRTIRRQALAFRWLLEAARGRNERTMSERLTAELIDAYKKSGTAIKKREDTHRMAEANKAFAHYKW